MKIVRKGRFALNRWLRARKTGQILCLGDSLNLRVFGVDYYDPDHPYLFPVAYEEIPQSLLLNRRLYTVSFSKFQRAPRIAAVRHPIIACNGGVK